MDTAYFYFGGGHEAQSYAFNQNGSVPNLSSEVTSNMWTTTLNAQFI
ncbi:hypothetical protein [Schlesneria sp.]